MLVGQEANDLMQELVSHEMQALGTPRDSGDHATEAAVVPSPTATPCGSSEPGKPLE